MSGGAPALPGLDLVVDAADRSAAENMARDSELAAACGRPVLRVYRWARPAVTYGYFTDVEGIRPWLAGRDHARRATGGGLVEHGDDLTLALAIPRTGPWAGVRSTDLYCHLHRTIVRSLGSADPGVTLFPVAAARSAPGAPCFEAPVPADLMLDGRKVGGGAIRRSRHSLLYQGSLRPPVADLLDPARLAANLTQGNAPRQPRGA